MQKIKFVYSDIGGVMLDFSEAFLSVTKKFNISFEEFHKFWLGKDSADDLTRGVISPQDFWITAIKKFNLNNADDYNFVENWMADYKPRSEYHNFIYKLAKRYKIGLVSNIYKGMMPRLVELGLVADTNYSAMVLSCDVGLRKPERKIYELATKESGVMPNEIFLIDDRIDFIEAARAYGWNTYWFNDKKVKETINNLEKLLLQ